MSERWTDEELMAYVDGTLPPHDAARIERILAHDAEARSTAELLRAGADAARGAFAPLAGAPVPISLARIVRDGPVRRLATPPRWALASAAAVLLALGFGGGWLAHPAASDTYTLAGAEEDEGDGPLMEALDTARDGESVPLGNGTTVTLTGPVDAGLGTTCRGYARSGHSTTRGLACRDQDGAWSLIEIAQP
jgi:anti-sigma factor RsiW